MKNNRHSNITILFLVLVCIIPLDSILAQDKRKIDSLKYLASETDSIKLKLNAYKSLSWEYAITRTKLDSAKMYTDSLYSLATIEGYPNDVIMADFYYGLIGRFSGDYFEALNHFDSFVAYHKEKDDSLKMEIGLYQKGVIHYNLGNYSESLDYYYQVLEIYEKYEMQNSIGTTFHSIGHIQRTLENYTDAIDSYEKSIAIKQEIEDKQGIIMSLTSLGNTYFEIDNLELAEEKLIEAYELCKSIDVPFLTANALESLGNIHQNSDRYEQASGYFEEAYKLYSKLPSKKYLAAILQALGNNQTHRKMYEISEQNLLKSLSLSKEINAKPIIKDNYKALKELHQAIGNFDKAVMYQDLFIAIKDSIFDQEKNIQLIELETKYKVAQQEKDMQLLIKENQLQEIKSERETSLRRTLVIILLLGLLAAGLVFHTMKQRFKNQKTLLQKNEEVKQAQHREQLQALEMKALRAQMNPHFLFNSINSINTLILEDKNENASRYLTKFSKLVRAMLENSETSMVTLYDELNMLNSYIQLEILRFDNKIDCNIEVEESIDQQSTYLPSMVLQPFVENAIWHGLLQSKKRGVLSIKIREGEDNLLCSIRDNGIGRAKAMELKRESGINKKSMGIKITTERLRLLTRKSTAEIITIVDLKDDNNKPLGTEVNIQFPYA